MVCVVRCVRRSVRRSVADAAPVSVVTELYRVFFSVVVVVVVVVPSSGPRIRFGTQHTETSESAVDNWKRLPCFSTAISRCPLFFSIFFFG